VAQKPTSTLKKIHIQLQLLCAFHDIESLEALVGFRIVTTIYYSGGNMLPMAGLHYHC